MVARSWEGIALHNSLVSWVRYSSFTRNPSDAEKRFPPRGLSEALFCVERGCSVRGHMSVVFAGIWRRYCLISVGCDLLQ